MFKLLLWALIIYLIVRLLRNALTQKSNTSNKTSEHVQGNATRHQAQIHPDDIIDVDYHDVPDDDPEPKDS